MTAMDNDAIETKVRSYANLVAPVGYVRLELADTKDMSVDTFIACANQAAEMFHDWNAGTWAPVDGWAAIVSAAFLRAGLKPPYVEPQEWPTDGAKREYSPSWRSDQIGALMIAATQAIDMVERMWVSENNDPPPPVLAKQLAEWRAAVAREERP